MYKSLNDTASTSQHVNVRFPTSKETHSYSTRFASTKNLHLPRPKTTDFKRDNVECWNEHIYLYLYMYNSVYQEKYSNSSICYFNFVTTLHLFSLITLKII